MRFRSASLILALILGGLGASVAHADFLIAQDFKNKSVSSIAYTYSGPSAIKGTEAVIVSGYSGATQGVATSGSNLYVTGANTASNQITAYTMSGTSSVTASINTSFGTSGIATLTSAGRGVSVTPDGSTVSVALLTGLKAVDLSAATGANTGPTLNLPSASNVYKSVQTPDSNFYVVNQPGTSAYQVNKFDSAGNSLGAITLTGFSPSTSALRDILFVGNNTFYLTNYAATAVGGGLYKFNLSGTTATLDNTFGTGGRVSIANAFGIAMDSKGTIFLSQYYSTTGGSSAIQQVNSSTGAFSIFKTSDSNFGFQYLAVTSVPEPSTYALAMLGVVALVASRRRKATLPTTPTI